MTIDWDETGNEGKKEEEKEEEEKKKEARIKDTWMIE